jgi:hypothetical protein
VVDVRRADVERLFGDLHAVVVQTLTGFAVDEIEAVCGIEIADGGAGKVAWRSRDIAS